MSEVQKIILGVIAAFIIGFVFVGTSKEKQTTEQLEAQSKIRNFAAIQSMATDRCVKAIKAKAGEQILFQTDVKSDQENYVTLSWTGEESKKGFFKKATCTFEPNKNGITELVIDDKVIIKKKI